MQTGDLIPVEDKSIPLTFFLTFRMLHTSFRLENLTTTLFGPLLGKRVDVERCWESLFQNPVFQTIWELYLYLSVSVPTTRGRHLILDISVWSTDKYSSIVVPTKQFASSVFVWAELSGDARLRPEFFIILPGVKYLFFQCLSRWNQTCSGITEPKQFFR